MQCLTGAAAGTLETEFVALASGAGSAEEEDRCVIEPGDWRFGLRETNLIEEHEGPGGPVTEQDRIPAGLFEGFHELKRPGPIV